MPKITKAQAKKCVTHHHACDCREYRYQEMEKALKLIVVWGAAMTEEAERVLKMLKEG